MAIDASAHEDGNETCKVDLPSDALVSPDYTPCDLSRGETRCVGCPSPDCPERESWALREEACDWTVAILKWLGISMMVFLFGGGVFVFTSVLWKQGITCVLSWVGFCLAVGATAFFFFTGIRHSRQVWTSRRDVFYGVANPLAFVLALCVAVALLLVGIMCFSERVALDYVSTGM